MNSDQVKLDTPMDRYYAVMVLGLTLVDKNNALVYLNKDTKTLEFKSGRYSAYSSPLSDMTLNSDRNWQVYIAPPEKEKTVKELWEEFVLNNNKISQVKIHLGKSGINILLPNGGESYPFYTYEDFTKVYTVLQMMDVPESHYKVEFIYKKNA